jgi:signal transduction histidine kinase
LRLADGLGLGWTAIVRQRAELALAPARTTRRTVFLIVFVAGLLAAAMAALATRLLTRRLTLLAADAEAVRLGDRRSLAAPAGEDEVSRIGATLSQVVDHLQSEKQALQTLNTELDRRVAERTQRIERMADESRHAAVTRERLRIARDLHDTLAHSLMALLTQIRLVRKLRGRMDATELDEELGRAEDVATTGLSESRAAIAQMRDNGVRDTGLGAAVQDLTQRFSARTGVAVALETDEAVAKSTDERAETVFRIIEEALRNVERHSGAQAVHVGLRSTPKSDQGTEVNIEVADDGIGFDTTLPRPGHYGLRGIHEQAALIGAKLGVLSKPGNGTKIVLAFDA